jgi:hypothetical protein
VSKAVLLREFTMAGWALPAAAPKSGHARFCTMLAAAFCVLALGGCAPRMIADGSRISRATDRAVHAKTVLKSGSTKKIVHARTKSPIPLADRSLLQPLPKPDCTFKGPLSNPITAEEMRMKLDYEQQCYRQSESIARERLQQLQDAVSRR